MTLYLAVDGGGSGCRACLVDGAGRWLGRGAAGPANIASDPQGACASILAAAQAALGDVDPASVVVGMGLAGVNSAGSEAALRAGLPFPRMVIASDAVTAAMGALGRRDGLVAALGTGSVFAVQQAGQVQTFGGWGFLLGDEGGGAWIGRAALSLALQAMDGFAPMTPFLQDLVDGKGGALGVVRWAAAARPADFAALAPDVLASDDPGARAVVAQAEAALRAPLVALRARYPYPVTLIGGLAAAFAGRLSDLPQQPAQGTALDGAIRLAMEAG